MNRRHTARDETADGVSCTVAGTFGRLSKDYKPGNEPLPGDLVTVFSAWDGHTTLTPFADDLFGVVGLWIATGVLVLGMMVLAVIRLIAGAMVSRRRSAVQAKGD